MTIKTLQRTVIFGLRPFGIDLQRRIQHTAAAAGCSPHRCTHSSLVHHLHRTHRPTPNPPTHNKMADAATAAPVPLLVCALAGNPVTGAAILTCLNAADATALRRLHRAIAAAVAAVPWADTDTRVVDVVRWRAALPGAEGARVTRLPVVTAAGAFAGVVHLDLRGCANVTDEVLLRLPLSLRVLSVAECSNLTPAASFARLAALASLDCSETTAVWTHASGLPPSLQELRMERCPVSSVANFCHLTALRVLACGGVGALSAATLANLPSSLEEVDLSGWEGWPRAAVSLAHLLRLRVFCASDTPITDGALATLPPCLLELDVTYCRALTRAETYNHLGALRTLAVRNCSMGDASLASLPPSLVEVDMRGGWDLTPAAVFPRLPALRVLNVGHTEIGDAAVASLPAGLQELTMPDCHRVTHAATLDHLHALQALHSHGTDLAPAVLAACRARGCVVSAAGVLRGHAADVTAFALLPDGRLACGDAAGDVRLWDVAAGGEATAVLKVGITEVRALAAFPDGGRGGLVVALDRRAGSGSSIQVWDVVQAAPVRRTTIDSGLIIKVVAALPTGGRLASGCHEGKVLIVDVGAGAKPVQLVGHTRAVLALTVLPDGGRLASGSRDATVRVWDVGTRVCVAKLVGSPRLVVHALAVLPDGRLASGSSDRTVRLWDVGAGTCVGELAGPTTGNVIGLVALPDGRLASAVVDSSDAAIWVWTRALPSQLLAGTLRPLH